MLPGRERDWSLVQVALTDITARKKAEAYLEFLGKHDVLTKLYNRSFFVDELNRLERYGPSPVTVLVADVNGLKAANDQLVMPRATNCCAGPARCSAKSVEAPARVARIGGDEFAILMPARHERDGEELIVGDRQSRGAQQSVLSRPFRSASPSARRPASRETVGGRRARADAAMYVQKRAFYADPRRDRRA